jgi:hypothetical protein
MSVVGVPVKNRIRCNSEQPRAFRWMLRFNLDYSLAREAQKMTRTFRSALVLLALIAIAAAAKSPTVAGTISVTKDATGEQMGDKCIRDSGGPGCCSGQPTCIKMVACNSTLNMCKKDKMVKDTKCSGSECQKCTSDYKSCHDQAVNAGIKPATLDCTLNRDGALDLIGTNPNMFDQTCSVTCKFTTADKQEGHLERSPVLLPKQSAKKLLESPPTALLKLPFTNIKTDAVCK